MPISFLLDPLRPYRQLGNHLAHLPHQIHATFNFFIHGLAVVVKYFNTNPPGIGRVVPRYDFVGLHDVRQFEELTHFAHLLDDGVVAALFFTDTSPFLDGLQPVDVVRPHRWEFTRVYLAGHHAGPRDFGIWVRRGVVDLRFIVVGGLLSGQSLALGEFLLPFARALGHLLAFRLPSSSRRRVSGCGFVDRSSAALQPHGALASSKLCARPRRRAASCTWVPPLFSRGGRSCERWLARAAAAMQRCDRQTR
mmetsp:Transcript_26128/g.67767  ORF Transcript_26128/g.67767 Transcript_26128/m.67767 type:complete len:251 (-) Transcript_26128:48-800(-)